MSDNWRAFFEPVYQSWGIGFEKSLTEKQDAEDSVSCFLSENICRILLKKGE